MKEISLYGRNDFFYYDEELGKGVSGGSYIGDEDNVFFNCYITNDLEGSLDRDMKTLEVDEYVPDCSLEDVFAPLEEGPIPILLHNDCLRVMELSLGDIFKAELRGGAVAECRIIGRFSEGPGSAVMSVEAFQTHSDQPRMIKYNYLEFTLAPSANRELESFRETVETEIKLRRGQLPETILILNDEELRGAVEPLERTNQLLRVLYPAALAVSVLAAAGLALMLISQCALETAIMRALGNPKRRVILSLWVEQMLLCAAGLAAGLLASGLLLRPDSGLWQRGLAGAALYLAGSAIAAAFGAVASTRKKPLELLQVKE